MTFGYATARLPSSGMKLIPAYLPCVQAQNGNTNKEIAIALHWVFGDGRCEASKDHSSVRNSIIIMWCPGQLDYGESAQYLLLFIFPLVLRRWSFYRDGSAIELVGLCKSVVSWLDEISEERQYPYTGVKIKGGLFFFSSFYFFFGGFVFNIDVCSPKRTFVPRLTRVGSPKTLQEKLRLRIQLQQCKTQLPV